MDRADGGVVKFWISFYVVDPDPTSESWPNWPGKWWISGETCEEPARLTVCGVVEADDEAAAITAGRLALGDAVELRFCDPKADDWVPGSRFPS